MSVPLFIYGSLMHPEVLSRVLGRTPETRGATLTGFRRGVIRGESFPGVVPAESGSVEGLLVFDLTPSEIAEVDRFEDDFYRRIPLEVLSESGMTRADVYVVEPRFESLVMAEEWDYALFVERDLNAFIQTFLRDA